MHLIVAPEVFVRFPGMSIALAVADGVDKRKDDRFTSLDAAEPADVPPAD